MTVKTFIDTNVLIYARQAREGQRRSPRAVGPPRRRPQHPGAGEVLRDGEDRDAAAESLGARSWTASRMRPGLGFWEALIVAAAGKGDAGRIVPEDLKAVQIIAGVRIENPFATEGASHE